MTDEQKEKVSFEERVEEFIEKLNELEDEYGVWLTCKDNYIDACDEFSDETRWFR